jgi:hypothetical protein
MRGVGMKALPVLAVLVVAALALFLSGCDMGVEKPVKDGTGPLAVTIARTREAPDYHSPLDWWTANHPNGVSDGVFSKRECMLCHVPEQSCNKCHEYVGAKLVNADGR